MKHDSVGGGRRPDLLNVDDTQIKLPDDVLLNILERVGTLDAVRTCLASKQTLKLLTMLSHIDIVLAASELDGKKNSVVADMTEKILSARSSSQIPIRNLKLKFIMRDEDHLKIGRAVTLAMATHKIEAAEFQILTTRDFHNCFLKAYRRYFAKQFNDFIGQCPDAFGGLTRLHLQLMRFGESDIPNILSTCKRLESLCLISCDSGVRKVLQVEHARLIELDMTGGYLGTVELNYLPKLQRMSYTDWYCLTNPLVLGFVPRLSNLSLSNNYGESDMTIKISQLLVNVPSVSELHLDFQSGKIWLHRECRKLLAPVLDKLRLLNLDNIPEKWDIAWTLSFLEVAPALQELCITVRSPNCETDSEQSYSKKTDVKWEPSVADFKHKNLAKLTIHGFQCDDNFTRYVRCVMKVAVNIREVSLHDMKVYEPGTKVFSPGEVRQSSTYPSRYPRTSREKDFLSKKITEKLVIASPDVIRFRPSCYYPPPVTECRYNSSSVE